MEIDLRTFLPTLVATFLGVFLAVFVDKYVTRKKEKQVVIALLEQALDDLCEELKLTQERYTTVFLDKTIDTTKRENDLNLNPVYELDFMQYLFLSPLYTKHCRLPSGNNNKILRVIRMVNYTRKRINNRSLGISFRSEMFRSYGISVACLRNILSAYYNLMTGKMSAGEASNRVNQLALEMDAEIPKVFPYKATP